MNGISGTGSLTAGLYLGAGALQTFSTGMQVSAHNIANISTANFLPQRELYATGPAGMGVTLDAVIRDPVSLGGENVVSNAVMEAGKDFSSNLPPEALHPSGTELAHEMPHMITTQRSFEANAKTVMAVDDMLGTLLNISV